MCKYPFGSGGKRVCMSVFLPDAMSFSIISSMKLVFFISSIELLSFFANDSYKVKRLRWLLKGKN
jgi:hypothetical protein